MSNKNVIIACMGLLLLIRPLPAMQSSIEAVNEAIKQQLSLITERVYWPHVMHEVFERKREQYARELEVVGQLAKETDDQELFGAYTHVLYEANDPFHVQDMFPDRVKECVRTRLSWLASGRDEPRFRRLFEHLRRRNTYVCDRDLVSYVLVRAAMVDARKIVNYLLHRSPLLKDKKMHKEPIEMAAGSGNLGVLKLFHKRGTLAMHVDSAMERAVPKYEILEYLCRHGGSKEAALYRAIARDQFEWVQRFVAMGANIHADNDRALAMAKCYVNNGGIGKREDFAAIALYLEKVGKSSAALR